jgi:hypothetical protein
VVGALLAAAEHPARADAQNGLALVRAAQEGHLEVVGALLAAAEHPARADARDSWALVKAAGGGHHEVVGALLAAAEHPARADSLALVRAAEAGLLAAAPPASRRLGGNGR